MTLFFDLDGPILDVSQRYVVLHERLAQELGFSPMQGDFYWDRKRARCPEDAILHELGADSHWSEYHQRRMERIETWEYLLLDRCWPWVPSVLEKLSFSFPLVIVTARANRPLLLQQLDHLGLSQYFRDILSSPAGKNVGQQKAALMEAYIQLQGEIRDGSWMIGDTEADIEAGKRLNLGTIAVLSGIRDEKHLAAAQADLMISNIEGLVSLPGFGSHIVKKERSP